MNFEAWSRWDFQSDLRKISYNENQTIKSVNDSWAYLINLQLILG
jgi:hypothetical protein